MTKKRMSEALAVMESRGWGVQKGSDGLWRVFTGVSGDYWKLQACQVKADHPLEAVLATDEWFVKNRSNGWVLT